MQICPDCGLRIDDDKLNESQPGCRCDRDEEFEFDYEGILADGEAFLRAEQESRSINANTPLKTIRCEGCGLPPSAAGRRAARSACPRLHQHIQARDKTKMQALVATMRKLLHAIFGMFKHDQLFDGAKVYAATDAELAPLAAPQEVLRL